MAWADALLARGTTVMVDHDGRRVHLHPPGHPPVTLRLVTRASQLRPSQVEPAGEPALLVTHKLTQGVREALAAHGWSWATDDGEFSIVVDHARLTSERPSPGDEEADASRGTASPPRRRGPPGYGTAAVARLLLVSSPRSQTDLAADAGVSQPRVSQVLATLADTGLVRRAQGGWAPPDRWRLLEWWLAHVPPDDGPQTAWASLDTDVWTATLAAVDRLDAAYPVRISGDPAADLYAPWRQPVQAIVYTDALVDLHPTGLVVADDPDTAVLRSIAPRDRSVLAVPAFVRRFGDRRLPLADPLIVLRDVAAAPGPDAAEAAAALRARLPEVLDW